MSLDVALNGSTNIQKQREDDTNLLDLIDALQKVVKDNTVTQFSHTIYSDAKEITASNKYQRKDMI